MDGECRHPPPEPLRRPVDGGVPLELRLKLDHGRGAGAGFGLGVLLAIGAIGGLMLLRRAVVGSPF